MNKGNILTMFTTASRFRTLAAAVTLVALPAQAGAQAATQAAPCLTEAEVRALATFAMPSALGGLIQNCSTHVGDAGFMTRSGSALVAGYAVNKDAAWPMARKAFFRLGGDKDKDSAEMMAKLPDSALQPFVEGMIGGMVGAKIKPEQCRLADKMMRLLAPLPPENMVELLGTVVELATAGDKTAPGGFAVCKS